MILHAAKSEMEGTKANFQLLFFISLIKFHLSGIFFRCRRASDFSISVWKTKHYLFFLLINFPDNLRRKTSLLWGRCLSYNCETFNGAVFLASVMLFGNIALKWAQAITGRMNPKKTTNKLMPRTKTNTLMRWPLTFSEQRWCLITSWRKVSISFPFRPTVLKKLARLRKLFPLRLLLPLLKLD